jgi:uncharacterized protein
MMKTPLRLGRTLTEGIQRQLQQFGESTPGVRYALLTSADGFEVGAFQAAGVRNSASKIAAMTSSITALADAMARETGLDRARNLIIESDDGSVVLLGLRDTKPPLSLAVVADRQAILGHLLWTARNVAAAITRATSD